MDVCLEQDCAHCCRETVPLLNEDLDRIVQMGHYDSFFSRVEKGWLVLQKLDGICVFYDNGCTIYERRPLSCRLAPLYYDQDDDAVKFDPNCPIPDRFQVDEEIEAAVGDTVRRLVRERQVRMRIKRHL